MLSGEIKLGGRIFQVVNYDAITVLNEHYIMKLMRATELDKTLPIPDEPDEAYLFRLNAKLIDALLLPALLAGYLLPSGQTETTWSLAIAGETRAFLEGLTRAEDKAEIHSLGQAVTLDFFRAGLESLKRSRSVLEHRTPDSSPHTPPSASPPRSAAH